MHASL